MAEHHQEPHHHQEKEGPQVHTGPDEGHPAGEGPRSDRDMGGPTADAEAPEEEVTPRSKGTRPNDRFEPHS